MNGRHAPLVILGCGFTGREVARQALAQGRTVRATVRDPAHAEALRNEHIDAHAFGTLTPDELAPWITPETDVLVAFPPDGVTDARIADSLARARGLLYLSTTGVFGEARGRIDERTPVDARTERAARRLEAESYHRAAGACVFRVAGIYGPMRGLHRRIADGTFTIPGDGRNVVSRIHVSDLAGLSLAALERAVRNETFVIADATPVPQIEAIEWLCARMGRPLPPFVPIEQSPETLRHDRAVDSRAVRKALDFTLGFPSYREGFADCLAREASRGG